MKTDSVIFPIFLLTLRARIRQRIQADHYPARLDKMHFSSLDQAKDRSFRDSGGGRDGMWGRHIDRASAQLTKLGRDGAPGHNPKSFDLLKGQSYPLSHLSHRKNLPRKFFRARIAKSER